MMRKMGFAIYRSLIEFIDSSNSMKVAKMLCKFYYDSYDLEFGYSRIDRPDQEKLVSVY